MSKVQSSNSGWNFREPLPVTILSGFLGSGKTSLLKQILLNSKGMKIAVIVNDMAEINIDGPLLKEAVVHETSQKTVLEFENGCICCSLREELLVTVTELALCGKFDYLVIESTGISEPQGVAETFAFAATISDAQGIQLPLHKLARIDTMVTLVDSSSFPSDLNCEDTAGERWGQGDDSSRTPELSMPISMLLVDQVEFADVVVLNKADLVDLDKLNILKGTVNALNPTAAVLTISLVRETFPVERVVGTGLFSMENAAKSRGWLESVKGEVMTESEQYGISSFVYRRAMPFHPARFHEAIELVADDASVLRSKGFVWLATRHDIMVKWSLAGSIWQLERGSDWHCDHSEQNYTRTDHNVSSLTIPNRDAPMLHNDRRQEIVVIGIHLDQNKLIPILDRALLSVEEFANGEASWSKMEDPLELWTDSEDQSKEDSDAEDENDDCDEYENDDEVDNDEDEDEEGDDEGNHEEQHDVEITSKENADGRRANSEHECNGRSIAIAKRDHEATEEVSTIPLTGQHSSCDLKHSSTDRSALLPVGRIETTTSLLENDSAKSAFTSGGSQKPETIQTFSESANGRVTKKPKNK